MRLISLGKAAVWTCLCLAAFGIAGCSESESEAVNEDGRTPDAQSAHEAAAEVNQ